MQVYGEHAHWCTKQDRFVHSRSHGEDEELSFRCDDGMCISIKGLCNGLANCQDASDEKEQFCGPQTTSKRDLAVVASTTTTGAVANAAGSNRTGDSYRSDTHALNSTTSATEDQAATICASENSLQAGECPECTLSATCACMGVARFGYGSHWSAWKQVSGVIQCSALAFEDPLPGHGKLCQCKSKEAQSPAGTSPEASPEKLQVSVIRKFPAMPTADRQSGSAISSMAGFLTTCAIVAGVISVSVLAYTAKRMYGRAAMRSLSLQNRSRPNDRYDKVNSMNEETELLADDSELEEGQIEYWQPVE